MSPTGKSYSFRSCVRASEAACAGDVASVAGLRKLAAWAGLGSRSACPSVVCWSVS